MPMRVAMDISWGNIYAHRERILERVVLQSKNIISSLMYLKIYKTNNGGFIQISILTIGSSLAFTPDVLSYDNLSKKNQNFLQPTFRKEEWNFTAKVPQAHTWHLYLHIHRNGEWYKEEYFRLTVRDYVRCGSDACISMARYAYNFTYTLGTCICPATKVTILRSLWKLCFCQAFVGTYDMHNAW